MKNILRIFRVIIIILSTSLLQLCRKEKEEAPTLITTAVSDIKETSAISGGTIISEGSGTIIVRGICWSTGSLPTTNDFRNEIEPGSGTFISNISGLSPATTYYVRAYARSRIGTGYGQAQPFTTKQGQAPTAITLPATNPGLNSATLNCEINANYLATTFTFEYGITSNYGSAVTPVSNWATDYSSIKRASINGLTEGTIYHYRVKAVNQLGTTFGNDVLFTTSNTGVSKIIFNPDLSYGSVTDIENNAYKTIQIGTQTWMAQNLRTTKYNDGTNIRLLTDSYLWESTYIPYYIWFNNDPATYKEVYGALYNFYSVYTDKLCPIGWHVPTDAEWTILTDYLGGEIVAGGKLKETGTTHWSLPNNGATNESGFTGLPGSLFFFTDEFSATIGEFCWWWSSSLNNDPYYTTYNGWNRYIDNQHTNASKSKYGG
jgi:uncharacterized protein (TIGR02145 family)